MKRAAVICANGIGDGLLMMIASHRLQMEGYAVTTYHPIIHELAPWFDTHRIEPKFKMEDLDQFDLVILQNDNRELTRQIIEQRHRFSDLILSVFYPSYEKAKHAGLSSWDQVFDEKRPMADNIAGAIASVLNLRQVSKNNGLTPPEDLIYQRYPKRIIFHPSAGNEERIWPLGYYIQVAKWLKKKGYEPVFAVSAKERNQYLAAEQAGFSVPKLNTLCDLAALLYESGSCFGNDSGTCHLASNLHLPTLVIANCYKRMRLWRPGWRNGEVLTPPRWIPNLKGSRVRENRWHWFSPPRRVKRTLRRLVSFL